MLKVGDIISWYPHTPEKRLFQVVVAHGDHTFDLFCLSSERFYDGFEFKDGDYKHVAVQDNVSVANSKYPLTPDAYMSLSLSNIIFGMDMSSVAPKICSCDLYSVIMPYGCQCGGK